MPGARRTIKLPYTEKNIRCPYCRTDLRIGTVMDKIVMSRRTCPICKKEFLVENDIATKSAIDLKKPSGTAKAVRTGKRRVR